MKTEDRLDVAHLLCRVVVHHAHERGCVFVFKLELELEAQGVVQSQHIFPGACNQDAVLPIVYYQHYF